MKRKSCVDAHVRSVIDHKLLCTFHFITRADVAELVDALASGASALRGVEVQVLSSVPTKNETIWSHFSLVLGDIDLDLHGDFPADFFFI